LFHVGKGLMVLYWKTTKKSCKGIIFPFFMALLAVQIFIKHLPSEEWHWQNAKALVYKVCMFNIAK